MVDLEEGSMGMESATQSDLPRSQRHAFVRRISFDEGC